MVRFTSAVSNLATIPRNVRCRTHTPGDNRAYQCLPKFEQAQRPGQVFMPAPQSDKAKKDDHNRTRVNRKRQWAPDCIDGGHPLSSDAGRPEFDSQFGGADLSRSSPFDKPSTKMTVTRRS